MIPASLGLILTSVAPERRSAAIGLWSASAAAAAAFGPPIGGLVVDQFGWRALFALNLPVGLAMLAGARSIPETERAEGRLPDVIGTVLLGTGIGLLVLGVTQGATWGWGNGRTLAALTVGAVMLRASLLRSRSHPAPALEIGLWRIRTFATANAVSFGFGVFLYAWMLNGVLFLVHVWGYSELRAGLAITPGAIAAAAVGIGIGRVANRVTPRALVAGGALLMLAAGLIAGLALPAEPDFVGFWLPLGTIVGFGFGAVSVGVSSAGALSVPPMRFAGATGLNLTGRQLGGAFGVAALATILRGDPGLHGAETASLMCAVAAAALLVLSPGLSLSPASAPATATAEAST
jgi:MFS family permease